jgi:cytochrome c oxidase assembly protein subunit 19
MTTQIADKYLMCLENEEGEAARCKDFVKAYLECRMSKQLMAKQDIGSLGIDPVDTEEASKG